MLVIAIAVLGVDPLVWWEKFAAENLYPHVPWFSETKPKDDLYTHVTEYMKCNAPATAFASSMVSPIYCSFFLLFVVNNHF
jgi:hypothetical protein